VAENIPIESNSEDHLTLPSTLASITEVEDKALAFARRAGFPEDDAINLSIVAREAAANAVIHGNKYSPAKAIHASFTLSADTLTFTLADQGEGIDVSAIPDPLAPENLLRASGRGVFLIRTFMDEVHFRQLTPGTEVTLVKHRVLVASQARPGAGEKSMSLKVKTRQVDGITILDLSGRITLGEGSVTLRDAVKDASSKGAKNILLNMSDVDYIDSSGIGELVSAFTSIKNQGGELKLLRLTKKVHDLLQITKLYTVFDIKDDEAVAVSSFTSPTA